MPEPLLTPLPPGADAAAKADKYAECLDVIQAVLAGESNWVAAMAVTATVLFQSFAHHFSWCGFYCVVAPDDAPPDVLVLGPHQGSQGCTRIPFGRGVCGAAARTRTTQLVRDVHARADHIACASSTQSEIVVPVVAPPAADATPTGQQQASSSEEAAVQQRNADGRLLAVLDVDSELPAAFDETDVQHLEQLCVWLAGTFAPRQRQPQAIFARPDEDDSATGQQAVCHDKGSGSG